MKKYYIVEENELLLLIAKASRLTALECGGVNNWPQYSESIWNYLRHFKDYEEDENFNFDDIAKMKIEKYSNFKLAE